MNDNQEEVDSAEKLFTENEVFIFRGVVCEIVYVLDKVYKVNRLEIEKSILNLFEVAESEDKTVIEKRCMIMKAQHLILLIASFWKITALRPHFIAVYPPCGEKSVLKLS